MTTNYFAKLMSAVAASRRGATAIEYALIAGLIGLVVATGATTLATATNNQLEAVGKELDK